MATNGNNILVYSGSTLLGGMKSSELQTDIELQEVSSPGQGEWKTYVPGRKSADIQVGYLVLAATSALSISGGNGIRDVLQLGNTFTLKFKARGEADASGVTGDYILKTCKISAVRGNLVTGTFRFVLNGGLT